MRIARLDGIRAIAVLLVILFHLGYHVTFGWVGVQLFFVLSGYLITGILRKTKDRPDYWSRFYKRRAARILPPMLLIIFVCAALGKDWKLPTILGYTFFAGNIMDFTRYGKTMLAPLWSLAVEEHFYLLWPLAVLLLNKRRLMILLACVLIAEPILRAFATPHFATFAPIYLLTPFQLDGLAAGSLLALFTEEDTVLSGQAWWLALVPGLAFCTVPYRDTNSVAFNALAYSYLALLFVAFVGWVVSLEDGFFYRLLSASPVAYIGRISYGIYLYHIPVGAGMHRLGLRFPLDALPVLAVAALSYHFIEMPIIEYSKREFHRGARETAEDEEHWFGRQG
jgi:peptidoglycan/LPS O-acetylase OafA/YrhL